MPLPASRVLPQQWAARHRPVVAGFFCDEVTIERRTGRVPVDTLGTEADVWQVLGSSIPALVQVNVSTANTPADRAGEPITVTGYLGRFDVSWVPDVGCRVTVTSSPDPKNLGQFMVSEVESQGHVVDRTVHLERVSPVGGVVGD